jgi:uncharacterized membrane protein (DUF2068 family)
MSFSLNSEHERVQRSSSITPDAMANAVAHLYPSFLLSDSAARAKIVRLIEAGAFTDAALALIELETLDWKLRWLRYDDNEWHCCLSKQVVLPVDLDEMAEASHGILPLAILGALAATQSLSKAAREVRPKSVPIVRPARGYAVCCDNFR